MGAGQTGEPRLRTRCRGRKSDGWTVAMKSVALALAAVAFLALPAPAGAKELTRAEVCGASGCATVTDRDALEPLAGAGTSIPPPATSSFYTVRLTVTAGEERHTWTVLYDPAVGAIRTMDESGAPIWRELSQRPGPSFESAIAAIEPFYGGTANQKRSRAREGSSPWLLLALALAASVLVAGSAVIVVRRKGKAAHAA